MTASALRAAYVLHQRPYRNTSLLVEAMTAEHGRVGLVARGVRGRKGTAAALLQPFRPLLMSWQGRGELKTLTAVEAAAPARVPGGRSLFAAYYCNELVLRLCQRGGAEPAAFAAYARALDGLVADAAPERALRVFELDLLEALGYAPPIDLIAATGEPVAADAEYDFITETGPLPAQGPRPVPSAVRVRGSDLLAMARREIDDPAVQRSARAILQAAIEPLLGNRPLRTRQVYRRLFSG